MYNLIQYLQPTAAAGYHFVEVNGYKENPSNPVPGYSFAPEPTKPTVGDFFVTKAAATERLRIAYHYRTVKRPEEKPENVFFAAAESTMLTEENPNLEADIKKGLAEHFIPTTEKLIVGKSGKVKYIPVHQGNDFQDTFMSFARLGSSDREIIAFVDRYGLPSEGPPAEWYGLEKNLAVFTMENWLSVRQFFGRILQTGATDENIAKTMTVAAKYIHIEVSKQSEKNPPRLVMVPDNLYAFMLLQFSEHVGGSSEIEFVPCNKCGLHFSRGRGTGRRIDALYCSASCYNAANYEKKKARSSSKN